MEFIWNDGGRAACGFVGLARDCATRAIAIATGAVYRDVYQQLGEAAEYSPRNGMSNAVSRRYLADRNWCHSVPVGSQFTPQAIPKGVVIVRLIKEDGRSSHLCAVIDHVVHDTWNPSDDGEYLVCEYWTRMASEDASQLPSIAFKRPASEEQLLTQAQFDKILHRIRALDKTATNSASTEGEKHNALRMMQDLMLRHNLSRDDIVDKDNVEHVRFTRIACPLNGRRGCAWEYALAWYLTHHIFTSVQHYINSVGHRTFVWFYGPVDDVQNTITLFKELLLTIATSAHLRFGGHSRGSGASYAEGYVQGLPRWNENSKSESQPDATKQTLIQHRQIAIHSAANQWLKIECDIELCTTTSHGRTQRDENARQVGRLHGSQHNVQAPNAPKRITLQ